MNKSNKNSPNHNSIEEECQYAYGFGDSQLEKMMDDAKAEADLSSELKPPEDEYQQILKKIADRGILPAPLESEPAADPPRRFRFSRVLKVMLVASIVGILVMGFAASAVGKRSFIYRVLDLSKDKEKKIWSNAEVIYKQNDVESAYSEIKEKLGFKSLVLNYIPRDMIFDKASIKHGRSVIQFSYRENYVYLYQYKKEKKDTLGYKTDRKGDILVHNNWINMDLNVAKNKIETGEIEYSVEFTYDDIYYYLCGITEESDFLQIVKGLSFYHN